MKKSFFILILALVFSVNTNALLTETGSSYKVLTVSNPNPLHMSIVKGDSETVKKIIEMGVDVNEKWKGLTPAMLAARYNRVEILNLLIKKGANLKLKSDDGYTAAEYAVFSKAVEAQKVIKQTIS